MIWRGIEIEVSHTKGFLNSHLDHIEVRAKEPLPITATGYRSHFLDPSDLDDYKDVEDFVRYWLEAEAKDWDGQLSLF